MIRFPLDARKPIVVMRNKELESKDKPDFLLQFSGDSGQIGFSCDDQNQMIFVEYASAMCEIVN